MFAVALFIVTFCIINSNVAIDDDVGQYAEDTLEESHGKIVHSSVLFRHGDRSIFYVFPTLEYKEEFWPEGIGQLNNIGKKRLYNLGKWFRQRYINTELSEGYRFDRLLMNSSRLDRTMMSAEVLLAGLLPPSADKMWAPDGLKWQPIPVHTLPEDTDEMLFNSASCERYDLETELANNSPHWQNFYVEHQVLLEYVSVNGRVEVCPSDPIKSLEVVAYIYDTLKILDEYNLTIPVWAKKYYPNPMSFLYSLQLYSRVYSPEMQKIRGGPFLKSVVSDMVSKRSGSTKRMFHFYSGHDTTLAAVLVTLGVYDFVTPPYGCSLIIELRKKDGQYIVTLLYRNDTNSPPYLLTPVACGEFCSLDKFLEITKPMIAENWSEECEVGFIEEIYTYNKLLLTVLTCIILLVLFAIVAFSVLLCVRGGRKLPFQNT